MVEYYLIAQLPSLDGVNEGAPLPITEERFLELCGRFLGKKKQGEIGKLTLVPPLEPERSSSALVGAWNAGERDLRLALGKARAAKMNKSFDPRNEPLPPALIEAANAAVELENPMEAEDFLSRHRLRFLETLRPADTFSRDYLYYYGIKLRLLLRIRRFDTERGKAAYRTIYSSILNGNGEEAAQ